MADWVALRGHRLTGTRFYTNDELPSLSELDWLIIMGGPMGIFDYQNYPWLSQEQRFIRKAIDSGKTIIGICLGAQLIANVLGAKIYRNRYKEIGWYPIEMTPESFSRRPFNTFPTKFEVFHWHGDTFEIPSNATRLAKSAACDNQAYIYDNRVIGLQFHLETTEEGIRNIVANCSHELVDAPFIQSAECMLSRKTNFRITNKKMAAILNELESQPC